MENHQIKLTIEALEKFEKDRIVSLRQEYIEMLDNLKKALLDKEEQLKTAISKIKLLEENKVTIDDKLNSYRETVRKLIREKDIKKLEDKKYSR